MLIKGKTKRFLSSGGRCSDLCFKSLPLTAVGRTKYAGVGREGRSGGRQATNCIGPGSDDGVSVGWWQWRG